MRIKITLRSKTTFQSDTTEAEVHEGQKFSDVALRIAGDCGCVVERIDLCNPVDALQAMLKETVGFATAWQCHLSDTGQEKAAATVAASLDRARDVLALMANPF